MKYKVIIGEKSFCFNDLKIKIENNHRINAKDNSFIFKVQITNDNFEETIGSYKQTGTLNVNINDNYFNFNVFKCAEINCQKDIDFFNTHAEKCPPM